LLTVLIQVSIEREQRLNRKIERIVAWSERNINTFKVAYRTNAKLNNPFCRVWGSCA